MALSATGPSDAGRSDRPAAREAMSPSRAPGGQSRTDLSFRIVDLESNTGNADWRRPGFVFSARFLGKDALGRLLFRSEFGTFRAQGDAEIRISGTIRLKVVRDGDGFLLKVLGSRGSGTAAGGASAAPHDPLAALLRTLGLPRDDLSASLLSFARAFGLSLDAERMGTLRRTVLRTRFDRGAAALAAAAAESKGVRLDEKAFDEYVSAIGADAGGGRRDGESGDGGNGDGHTEKRSGNDGTDAKDRDGRSYPDGAALADLFAREQEASDALSLLNALPAGDGSRWIVFPVVIPAALDISEDGSAASGAREEVEIRATVRILLVSARDREKKRVGKWAMDVRASARTWFFSAEPSGTHARILRVSADPPLGGDAARTRAALARSVARFGFSVEVSERAPGERYRDCAGEPYEAFEAEA